MMKDFYKKTMASIVICTCFSVVTYSQNFDAVFDLDIDDATSYVKEYAEPTVLAFSNGLSGGWYNTAKPHKLWGFDLTVTSNVVRIPDEEKVFDFNSLNWNSLQVSSGSSSLPTLTGLPTSSKLEIPAGSTIRGVNHVTAKEIDAPNGTDIDVLGGVPVPTFQLGVGVIKNTDLKIRWIPTIGVEDGSISMWGLGAMHDIKQWIPGIKTLPFDLSIILGHTSLKLQYDINKNDGDFLANGEAAFKIKSTTFQALISKKLSVFTPYLGLGFNGVKTDLLLSDVLITRNEVGFSEEFRYNDISFNGGGSALLKLGFRLKFAVITLHADYTLQKYSMFSAGLGINVR